MRKAAASGSTNAASSSLILCWHPMQVARREAILLGKGPSRPWIPITVRVGQCVCRPRRHQSHSPQPALISPTTRCPFSVPSGDCRTVPTNSCPRIPGSPCNLSDLQVGGTNAGQMHATNASLAPAAAARLPLQPHRTIKTQCLHPSTPWIKAKALRPRVAPRRKPETVSGRRRIYGGRRDAGDPDLAAQEIPSTASAAPIRDSRFAIRDSRFAISSVAPPVGPGAPLLKESGTLGVQHTTG